MINSFVYNASRRLYPSFAVKASAASIANPMIASVFASAMQCSTAPLGFSMSHQAFRNELNVSFSLKNSYALSFQNCSFDPPACLALCSEIVNQDIRELSLAQTEIPQKNIPELLESCLIGNLQELNMSGIPLESHHIQLLQKQLSASTIKSLYISPQPAIDVEELKKLSFQLGVSLQLCPLPAKKATVLPENTNKTISASKSFFLCISDPEAQPQGGFDAYKIVQTVHDFEKMKRVFQEGIFVNLIRGHSQREKKILHAVAFTVANGRGFVVPFSISASQGYCRHGIREILENPSYCKAFRDYRRDAAILSQYNIQVRGLTFSIFSAVRYLNRRNMLSEKKFKEEFLLKPICSQSSSADSNMEKWVSEKAKSMARTDYPLYLRLTHLLKKTGHYSFFTDIFMPLQELLISIEHRGLVLNKPYIDQLLAAAKLQLEIAESHLKTHEELLPKKLDWFSWENIIHKLKRFYTKHWFGVQSEVATTLADQKYLLNGMKGKQNIYNHLLDISEAMVIDRLSFQYNDLELHTDLSSSYSIHKFLQEPYLSSFFSPDFEQPLYVLRFDNLPFRAHVQFEGSKALRELCINRKNIDQLAQAISLKIFGSHRYTFRTSWINMFVSGQISEKSIRRVLQKDTDVLLARYSKIFSGRAHVPSFTAYEKKIRQVPHVFFYMFLAKLYIALKTHPFNAKIVYVDRYTLLLNIPPSETKQIYSLVREVHQSVARWEIPVPYFLHSLANSNNTAINQNHEKKIIETFDQGVIGSFDYTLKDIVRSVEVKNTGSPRALPCKFQGEIDNILKTFFEGIQLKPLQETVIHHVLLNYDTIALLPTGYGKTLCFQTLALIKDGITLVISPLISLISARV